MNDLESSPIIESKRKRGRETFRQLKPIFCFVSFLMRVFPEFFCNWLLRALRYTRGSIGLGLRYILASRLAESCGDNVSIHDCVFLRYVELLNLGNNVSIHPLCYIDAQGGISIGNDVSIAHNVSILSFEHDFSDTAKLIKDTPCIPKEIIIEDNVWIGAGVRILGGVRVGTGSIIGAGAVATKDIPPMSIAVGVPARVVASRE